MPRLSIASGKFDPGDESDLRQDYQNAVDCLIQCETLFNSFQEQLQSKDDRIAVLEDKVMELSLELAAVKARQDLPYLKKRETAETQGTSRRQSGASSSDRRTSWTSESSGNVNKLPNLGLLINRSFKWIESKQQLPLPSNGGGQGKLLPNSKSFGGGENNGLLGKMPRRHTTAPVTTSTTTTIANLRKRSSGSLHLERPLRRSKSSASSGISFLTNTLEGVIFPVSSFEVYSKGCRVNKAKSDMKNSEWPSLG